MGQTMEPLPAVGEVPPGALVWGSDFNAAEALLYRWWGLIDAPLEIDTAPCWDDLFDADPRIVTPDMRADDLAALRRAVASLRGAGRRAHHLGYDACRLLWREHDLFELRASFRSQHEDLATRRSCVALLWKRADGRLVFRDIKETTEGEDTPAAFEPSYLVNRARATIVQFQAHMDGLSGKTDDMHELMMPQLELHGLVASKKDESSAGEDLTDVNDLRKSIAGTDTVADNIIRDAAGFAAWFATCKALFVYGLHKLEHFSVTSLPDRRFAVVAQFDWQAQTLNGAKIETHHPLTWVLVDADEKYMRIEKLLPFG